MRLSSWIAALAVALVATLFWQPAANSSESDAPESWQAEVAAEIPADPALDAEALRATLTPDDPVALLEALRVALDEVADGATYVWHRVDAPLQGAIRPTASFRDDSGAICRRLSVTLTLGATSRWTDAVACREDSGRWSISG
jgi:surface antigen